MNRRSISAVLLERRDGEIKHEPCQRQYSAEYGMPHPDDGTGKDDRLDVFIPAPPGLPGLRRALKFAGHVQRFETQDAPHQQACQQQAGRHQPHREAKDMTGLFNVLDIHRYSSVQSAASLPHAATERTLGKGWERGFVIYSASLEAVPIKQVFKIPVEQLELADQCSPESFKGFVTPNRFCFDSFDHKSAQRL